MCLAIPGQIVSLMAGTDLATCDVSGVKRTINLGLLDKESIAAGDWVLIHVGFAMSKVDEAEARSSLEFLRSLGEQFTDEIAALEGSDRQPERSAQRSG